VKILKDLKAKLFHLGPMWKYVCPHCKKATFEKLDTCPYCGRPYGIPHEKLRVPPRIANSDDERVLSDYVHKRVMPWLTPEEYHYLAQHFTVVFAHGFEGGNFGNDPETGYSWTGTIGAPSVTAGSAHHGTYKAVFDANGEQAYRNLTSATHYYFRFYFRTDLLPAEGQGTSVMDLKNSGGFWICNVYLRRDSGNLQIRVFDYILAVGNFNITIVANQWYCYEMEYFVNASGKYEVWWEGSSVGSVSGNNAGHSNIGILEIGRRAASYAPTLWYDCVVVADTRIYCEVAVAGGGGNPAAMQSALKVILGMV